MKRFVKVILMSAIAIGTGVGIVWAATLTHESDIVKIDGPWDSTGIEMGQPKQPGGASGGVSKIVQIDNFTDADSYMGINASQIRLNSIAYPNAPTGASLQINSDNLGDVVITLGP